MVYSIEHGYDPEEWEECPKSNEFFFIGFFTKIVLIIITIGTSAFLFWILKFRKQNVSSTTTKTFITKKDASNNDETFEKISNDCVKNKKHKNDQLLEMPPSFFLTHDCNDEQESFITENSTNSFNKLHKKSIEIDDTTANEIKFVNKKATNKLSVGCSRVETKEQTTSLSNQLKNIKKSESIELLAGTNLYNVLKKQPNTFETEQVEKLLLEYDLPEKQKLQSAFAKFTNIKKQNLVQLPIKKNHNDETLTKEANTVLMNSGFDIVYRRNSQLNNLQYYVEPIAQENNHSDDETSYDQLECYGNINDTNVVAQEQQLLDKLDMISSLSTKFSNFNSLIRKSINKSNAFVIEEKMVESDKQNNLHKKLHNFEQTEVSQLSHKLQNRRAKSAEPTSFLLKTNKVFKKPEILVFDDADDAMTYAPEIQSVEIPPDQLSENENSLNLVENFSECHELPVKKYCNKNKLLKLLHNNTENEEQHTKTVADGITNVNINTPAMKLRLRQKRHAAPTIFSFNSHPQKKKAPMFLRRNIGFFDISDSVSTSSTTSKQSNLLSALGVTSTQEMLLKITSLNELSEAMRIAGLESTNIIFGIDYTASNKYQGEHSFNGRSLHSLSANNNYENPYQQVIKIMGKTLRPFANDSGIPVYGFGDLTTGDWSVFALNGEANNSCRNFEEVLEVYNEVTHKVDLSGPTNFAPLIYQTISICQKNPNYHILIIIADGQVTNERATRKAIVHACQYPLSIIVVGVGDGPWDTMKIFDESLPKRPWDNFHFVEFHKIINSSMNSNKSDHNDKKELEFAIQSLLEIPDQYHYICKMGIISSLTFQTNYDKTQTLFHVKKPDQTSYRF